MVSTQTGTRSLLTSSVVRTLYWNAGLVSLSGLLVPTVFQSSGVQRGSGLLKMTVTVSPSSAISREAVCDNQCIVMQKGAVKGQQSDRWIDYWRPCNGLILLAWNSRRHTLRPSQHRFRHRSDPPMHHCPRYLPILPLLQAML